ncbi:hypothetical protein [Pelagibius sp. Alg239-R121]|uniref:hypothetical protein n=1 Tax=Pelagibius sp. Alg239-R121 TaxID=2993448 RepID=UPI0024A750AE|nr:hypothetical protein [Pelagibius sp. Alg239-R121]
MSRLENDWKSLNAYVDGELSPNEAADVARKIARDPEAAAAAASLSSLKSSLLEDAETSDEFELFPQVATPLKANALWQASHLVAAAAILVVCIAVGALYQWSWTGTGEGLSNVAATAWYRQATDIHQEWAVATANERPPSLTITATGNMSAAEIRIPDLSDSGLVPILLEPVSQLGAMDGYRVGYGGSRGCRISLFVLQGAGEIPDHLAELQDGVPQVYAWRHDEARYLLLAEGMAGPRFQLIARTLKNVTAKWQPLAPDVRTALQSNRRESVPCAV